MAKIFNIVGNLFKKHPFLTNSAVYGSLYVGAEFSQQYLTKRVLVSINKWTLFHISKLYEKLHKLQQKFHTFYTKHQNSVYTFIIIGKLSLGGK